VLGDDEALPDTLETAHISLGEWPKVASRLRAFVLVPFPVGSVAV
jgi:hypothetical protein